MHHVNRFSVFLCLALLVAAAGCRDKTADGGTATTGEAIKITDVTLGRAIGGDKAITDKTETFRPNDTIYASVATEGAAANATLRARWTYEDGQVVDESSRTLTAGNRERTEFHISKPGGWPAGTYQVEVTVDGRPAETKKFEVRAN